MTSQYQSLFDFCFLAIAKTNLFPLLEIFPLPKHHSFLLKTVERDFLKFLPRYIRTTSKHPSQETVSETLKSKILKVLYWSYTWGLLLIKKAPVTTWNTS